MKTQFYIVMIIVCMISIQTTRAQDFHFSQYDANPFYLNPALTGERMNGNNGIQMNLNYREQLGNYQHGVGSNASIAAGLDVPLTKRFSLGEFVTNNRSVDGSFNTFNLMISGAYNIMGKSTDGENRNNLSVGVQVGLLQKSIHPQNFSFDSQYSPNAADGFNLNLPSGENFTTQNLLNFDANVGIYYRTTFGNKRFSPFAGFSIYHITQPNESFTGGKSLTPMRFNLHGGINCKVGESVSIMPQFLYMTQAKATEINAGMLLFYKVKDSNYEPLLGAGYRNNNALIIQFGLKTKSSIFRISYDLNTSYLRQYNNKGLELSIIYTGSKKSKSEAKGSPKEESK